MGSRDFAVVIGISRYPRFGSHDPAEPHDLEGPDNDARAIRAWLIDPNGGSFDPANVALITSADLFGENDPPASARPHGREIAEAFAAIASKPRTNGKVGRRLVVYASGHGFGRDRVDGGLYTATASPVALDHFYVRSWFRWFRDTAYFEEYVLWVDACMTRLRLAAPHATTLPVKRSPDAHRGRVFEAYAARFPGKAIEKRMPNGNVHGLFSYALLRGLRGAAVQPGRRDVTVRSLQNYLYDAVPEMMLPEDRADPDVSIEPDFGPTDEMVLAQDVDPMLRSVLRFPGSAHGLDVVIRDGALRERARVTGADRVPVDLVPGFYKAEAPSWSALFEVGGGADEEIALA